MLLVSDIEEISGEVTGEVTVEVCVEVWVEVCVGVSVEAFVEVTGVDVVAVIMVLSGPCVVEKHTGIIFLTLFGRG